jgi:predicted DNA-binding ribbon-helix-helix protein
VTAVDSRRDQMAGNLSSALRVFCLRWTQSKAGTIA